MSDKAPLLGARIDPFDFAQGRSWPQGAARKTGREGKQRGVGDEPPKTL